MNTTSTTSSLSTTAPTLPTTSSSPAVVQPISSSSSSERVIATDSPTIAGPTEPPTTTPPTTLPPTTADPPTTSSTKSTTSSSSSTSTSKSETTKSSSSSSVTTPPPQTRPTTIVEPGGSTYTSIITFTQPPNTLPGTKSSSSISSSTSASNQTGAPKVSKGLGSGGTIALAVVVPIVAVALIVLAGLFLWRKRKARKDAEELRRAEVEEYGYNPNNDPKLPPTATAGSDGPFEMREDGSSGYRGWGTTAVPSSTGRKASTTVSGGQSTGIGMAYSEGTSATGAFPDNRSDQPLVDGSPVSPQGEHLGAMGPAASTNRAADINRGPSNASSSYSAANRSDGSGEYAPQGTQYYSHQYDTANPYGGGDTYGGAQGPTEMPAQPVIRDVSARRNTRIENPSHFPQQSAGISQNF